MLILLRHGQTTANAQSLLQGRIDLDLDAVGQQQAALCGQFVRQHFPHARIVSSPLVRAQQTALAISPQVEIDERFIELDYGSWDGVAMSAIDPVQWARWRSDPHFRPPNGESLVELDERVRPALVEMREEAMEKHIVIVSHVSPIKSAVTWALGTGPESTWRMHLDRASLCRVAVTSRGATLASFNETGHLLPVG
jgi:probable phosphoglycerate mutase